MEEIKDKDTEEKKKDGFVHLHVHSEYSILDGAAKISELVKKCKEYGMDSVAVTDHGNMYGAVALYDACRKAGIKAIYGCEFYVCDDLTVKTGKTKLSHLILLVKNYKGYKNLCLLNTIAFRDGFYYKPRIDYKTLREHAEGLICLSACIAGDLPQLILNNRLDDAKEYAQMMKDMFAPGDYYIEVQNHSLEEEKYCYPHLVRIAKELGIKTVATNDVHYINRDDALMQDVLMCVQMVKSIYDTNRMKFNSDDYYLKSPEEMKALFPDNEECIKTTLEIAEKCNFSFEEENIDKNLYHFPNYQPPDGSSLDDYFRKMIEAGLIRRYGVVTPQIRERVESELKVIQGQKYTQYFLTVWDYIRAAKEMGVPVGPGRGSGAGSVVAYAIGITNIDPLKFDLIFERFLHTERVTAPDFDIDFADDRRADVIEYVKHKYGEDKVVKILTFGTMAAKNAIKDVGRVMNVPYSELDKITKAIPNIPAKHHDVLKKCFGFYHPKEGDKDYGTNYAVQELVDAYNSNEEIKKVVDVAMKLEGMPRQCSTHACGIVIGFDTLEKHMPLSRNGEDITTQYSMTDIERLGHLKMDFLGLRNLNDIEKAKQYIKEDYGVDIDFDKHNYDDQEVYKMISTGNTKAVFQIESPGFQKFMRELRPTCIEDITAGVSLYRPGPMDSIPRYVHNKHNPQDVTYIHPILEPVLNVTYGCIVYQEQVMRIVQDMAGYTLGQADMVRRMMGKKKVDDMAREKNTFLYGKPAENGKPAIDGAIKRGVPKEAAEQVWSEMESFAQYAFNKSHAAAYSLITYQTAYLKCYYEVEFLTAVLNNRITSSDEIKNYVAYAKSEGITILPPDINKSKPLFSVENKGIRFGIGALKNMGMSIAEKIVNDRKENGDYKDIQDLIQRVNKYGLNKKGIEALILSGALDCFGYTRTQLMAVYEDISERVSKDKKAGSNGQMTMFGTLLGDDEALEKINYPDIAEFSDQEKLKKEKEVVGVYVSGHPMDKYMNRFSSFNFNCGMISEGTEDESEMTENIEEGQEEDEEKVSDEVTDGMMVSFGAIINEVKKIYTKKDQKEMGILSVEDMYGSIDVMLFPKIFTKYKPVLQADTIGTFYGKLSIRVGERPIVLLEKFEPWNMEIPQEEKMQEIETPKKQKLYLKFDTTNEPLKQKIIDILNSHIGTTEVYVQCSTYNKLFKFDQNVEVNNILKYELMSYIDEKYILVK